MIVIFVVWLVLFVHLILKYGKVRAEAIDREGKGGGWALAGGVAVIVFELVLIVIYSVPTWSLIKINFPDPSRSNVIQVVAEQYAWNVQYPGADGKLGRRGSQFIDSGNVLGLDPKDPAGKDDVVTLNELRAPLGKPTLVYLEAKDVIHSFFIPEFRVKQDATPGLRVPVWFEPTKAGKYELCCSQLCGVGHTNMRADVIVEPLPDFEAWLKSQAPAAGGPS